MSENANAEPVKIVTLGDSTVTLLGTAHVSRQSADMVKEMIASGDYDAVAIELCDSRHKALVDPDSLAKQDLLKVIRSGKAPMVMASLALGAFQQRLADQFGIEPGAEMRVATHEAKERDIPLHLIDREIGTTLKRVYRSVPWWKRMGIFSGLLASVLSRDDIQEHDIERLKQGDMLESTFEEFSASSGELYRPLIDERDRFMSYRIYESVLKDRPKNLLAVVGAGHLRGINEYLKALAEELPNAGKITGLIENLNEVPQGGKFWKVFPWAIVALILVGFGIGFARSPELGWNMVADWVLINGGLSALGALIAMAHPLTILGAFLAAPLTSLNPTVGAGMVTASIELMFRRPTVEDFGRLRQDTAHWKGWWQNRVSRVLLVFFLSTLGSAVGTYVAGFRIFGQLTGG